MKDSIRFKLENLTDRQEEINALLSDPATQSDQNYFRKLSIELSEISPIIENYLAFRSLEEDAQAAQFMLQEDDQDMRMRHTPLLELNSMNPPDDLAESVVLVERVPKLLELHVENPIDDVHHKSRGEALRQALLDGLRDLRPLGVGCKGDEEVGTSELADDGHRVRVAREHAAGPSKEA